MPAKPRNQAEEKENYEPHKDDLRKAKASRNQARKSKKQPRPRAESHDERSDSDHKNPRGPSKKLEERKQVDRRAKPDRGQRSRQDDHRSYSDERWRHNDERDRYDPMPRHHRDQRRPGGPPQKMFDSDYDHDPRGYAKGSGGHYRMQPDRFRPPSDDFERPQHYYRGPPPMHPRDEPGPPRYQPRYPPSRSSIRGRPGPPPRGGGHMGPRDFERPERPGYYAGNRPFRMDKIRDQPLENLHSRAADQIERERRDRMNKNHMQRDHEPRHRPEQREMRDTRNRPAQVHSRD